MSINPKVLADSTLQRRDDLPLSGIRVLDLTVVWSGPGATVLLGDLGAEIIKVECTTRATRGVGNMTKVQAERRGYFSAAFPDSNPEPRAYNRTAVMNGWHGRNKLSVTLPPLETLEGRELFLRLAAISDVVIENNSARVLPKLGLDYDDLRVVNPRIVVLRMAPLGLSGPMANYIGYGPNFNSLVGIAAMDGYDGDDPTTAGENYHMDECSPAGAAFAAMAALWERETSGEGQLVEFAQAEHLMHEIGEFIVDAQVNDRSPKILGNSHPLLVQNVFPVAETASDDRWIAVSIRTGAEWLALQQLVGEPLRPWSFVDVRGAMSGDPVIKELDAWFATQPIDEVLPKLQRLGIPAAETLSELQVLADPHLLARGWFRRKYHPETGEHLYLGHPWSADSFDLAHSRPLPAMGEDNEYVYKTLLNFSDQEYRAGEEAGFIGRELRE
jgi:crotonobetainyl-CoA:carnitine CoA-transferase CaiB-like acyl-CoA transferase